jgi:hypothetical protein
MKNQLISVFFLLFVSTILCAQNLSGSYSTVQNGVECVVILKQAATQITGQVSIGEEKGTLQGTIKTGVATGTITDAATQQIFTFEAKLVNNILSFTLFVKDDQSGVSVPLTFLLERSTAQKPPTPPSSTISGKLDPANAPKKPRDSKLVGTWRTTETINSGSGEFYMGISTDYFMQFTSEGVAGVWQGKSAGGGAGTSFSNEGDGAVTQLYWYTESSVFVFMDPSSKETLKTKYQFHDGQLVTTNQQGKYVFWTKVQ